MQIDNNWIGESSDYIKIWQQTKNEIFNFLENYEIDKANDLLYQFFWNTFCSIWIEDSKKAPTSITLKKIIIEIKDIIYIFYK
jgi:valyl-tRNA synthetase